MNTVERLLGLRAFATGTSKLKDQPTTFDDLIVGIELEIEGVGHLDFAAALCDISIWQVKDDGSLRPPGSSWEYVSYPLPMKKMVAELDRFFQNTHFNDDNYSDRTSIHVHTNVRDFVQKQVASLALTYVVFEDVLFNFVNFYNCGKRESFFRDTNLYCIPWTHCRLNHEFVRKFFNDPKGSTKNWQKYTALNLLSMRDKGTVEWRHMHGTNDMDKLRKWLNIIGCIMRFAKEIPYDELVKAIETLNDTSAYQQFFTRVFGNVLDYNEEYARSMAEGVINAKLSLMNKDKKVEKRGFLFDEEVRELAENPAVAFNFNQEVDARLLEARARENLNREAVNQIRAVLAERRVEAAPARPRPPRREPAVPGVAAAGRVNLAQVAAARFEQVRDEQPIAPPVEDEEF